MGNLYKSAGVDILAGDKTVAGIKQIARRTFNKYVLSGIGYFGAFYNIDLKKYHRPVLVSSVDGVGTKLKIAFMMDKHDTIGQDLVNHCVNDIAVCGADPHFFMDYLAFGKLNVNTATQIIKGFAKACKENNVALIGGETAEMPGFYKKNEYDISGTIIGIVDRDKLINGSSVKSGDVVIGFASNGLHTNGYSLARKVLLKKFKLTSKIDILNSTLGEELLRIHKSYLSLIKELTRKSKVKAFAHITGGGIIGNTKRVLPKNLDLYINWDAWEMPQIFKLIKKTGKIPDEEMREVFNLGIGLVAIVGKNVADKVITIAEKKGEKGIVIGEIKKL
ncbi:phosphoribosylformylglycinamidine cyclo-ligase [Melioribacteraceae bacterium 4301-Me]|uniref:phosphoribosylformylglycinamidine cyclo-ligase n=1 Tax=Pyranulibacter aquaticus TaxID=3163344 RepID=UPI0035989487